MVDKVKQEYSAQAMFECTSEDCGVRWGMTVSYADHVHDPQYCPFCARSDVQILD